MRGALLIGALLAGATGTAAPAQCRIQTAGSACVEVPLDQRHVPLVAPGDVLEPGAYQMLFGTLRYGLPMPQDGWVYFEVGRDIVRVDLESLTVLEIVTDQANRGFR